MGGRRHQRRLRPAAGPAADAGAGPARDGIRSRPPAVRGGRFGAARRRGTGAAAQVQGRWSLTEPLLRGAESDPSVRRRALGELLLERYGIVTREQVLAEGIPGGFSAIYAELSQLETLGVARRGYFLEGLGGAQFALPGAVERLRARGGASGASGGPGRACGTAGARRRRPGPALRRGAAVAQAAGRRRREPRGRRPARVAGAYVVLVGGDPVVYLERGGRALQTLVATGDARIERALSALVDHVRKRGHQARRSGEGRRRVGDDLAAGAGVARARLPGGPAAAHALGLTLSASCQRATPSPTRRTGCARSSRVMCPTRSAPPIRATPWIAGPSGWPVAPSRRCARTASTCSWCSTATWPSTRTCA